MDRMENDDDVESHRTMDNNNSSSSVDVDAAAAAGKAASAAAGDAASLSGVSSSRRRAIDLVRNDAVGEQQQQRGRGGGDEGFLTVEIHPTTGGHFKLQLHKTDSVEQLKRVISRKLTLAKDRICLLYKDRDLREGNLSDNQVKDGGKVTLLPIVETGLMSQKPEQSVLQALESLSDAQVNTFLEGKAPLNLTMRLGDHMMFIQLQLSTVGGGGSGARAGGGHNNNKQPTKVILTDSVESSSSSRCPRPAATTTTTNVTAPSSSSSSLAATEAGHIQLLDTRTLAEASRNLSHTLQHLSSQALYNRKSAQPSPPTPAPQKSVEKERVSRRPGAIIESMHHHGRGVYSGTFSGTLNPALQDRNGNPKRDISTIVHILNDLLGASPHYRRSRGGGGGGQLTSLQGRSGCSNAATARLTHKSDEEATQLSQENLTTRGKMEQLQLLLQERRDRRRARREARAPYVQPQLASHWPQSSSIVVEPMAIHDNSSSTPGSPMECGEEAAAGVSDTDNQEYLKLKPETVVI